MQRKSVVDFTTTRTSRIDRFAQMSKVEQVIEQKKREIQARLQKSDSRADNDSISSSNTQPSVHQSPTKTASKPNSSSDETGTSSKNGTNTCVNIFSNDGSFLDQFKQLNKETSSYSYNKKKSKSENAESESYSHSERLEDKKNVDRSKSSRWSTNRDKESYNNGNYSNSYSKQRYQEKSSRFEQNSKNFIPSLFNKHNNYQQDMKNTTQLASVPSNTLISPNYPPPSFSGAISVPPPTHIQNNLLNQLPINVSNSLISESGSKSNLLSSTTIPPTPAIQLQNIPPPLPIRLNEIPNPKPLDIQNIPPPGQLHDKNLINTEVLKNIPPPNKSIPPPCINSNPTKPVDNSLVNINVCYPPPNANTTIPIVPPPVLATQTIIPPPSNPMTTILHQQGQFSTGIPQSIPPLMAQPVLPPSGLNVCIQPQINLPPPAITTPCVNTIVGSTTASVIPPLLTQPPPNAQITNAIPPMTVPPPNLISTAKNNPEHCLMRCEVCPIGSESYAAMSSVARMVAQCGTSFEDAVRQRSHQDPKMWFVYDKNSPAYHQYLELVNQYQTELNLSTKNTEYKPEDLYEPDNVLNSDDKLNNENEQLKKDIIRYPLKDPNEIKKENPISYVYSSNFSKPIQFESESVKKEDSDSDSELNDNDSRRRKRKRKSRWGNQSTNIPPPPILSDANPSMITLPSQVAPIQTSIVPAKDSVMLTKVKRTDPALLQYAMNTFGTTNLSEDDWQKAEDHYKINLLYQDMLRKRQELERLQKAGKFKYEYDSDEEVDGGTWEHKIRMQEMEATKLWATELTKKAEGKHHIGDFLPPEELRKFLEQSTAAKEGREPELSDYKEYKLNSDNIGFKMLQKLGWSEGQGLGSEGSGIVEPINKASQRDSNQGLGLTMGEVRGNDDEYDAYRKRMMLAYRFRPNPLNNPRRSYY